MKWLRAQPPERLSVQEDLPASSPHCCTAPGFCRGGWTRPRKTTIEFCSWGLKSDSDQPADTKPCDVLQKRSQAGGFSPCVASGQFSLQKCRANFPRPLLSSLSSSSSFHSTRSLSLCGSPASASCDCGSAALHHYCPPSCSLHLASWLLHIYWFCVYLCSSSASSWLCQHRRCRRRRCCCCCSSSPPSFAFPPRASSFSFSSCGKISLIASRSLPLCQTWTFSFFDVWLSSCQSFCHY